jgi:hypothetical protein
MRRSLAWFNIRITRPSVLAQPSEMCKSPQTRQCFDQVEARSETLSFRIRKNRNFRTIELSRIHQVYNGFGLCQFEREVYRSLPNRSGSVTNAARNRE